MKTASQPEGLDSSARIIVLFGNVPLYGSERANIETLDQLQQRGAAVLFLIRKDWTEQAIQPELRRRQLAYRAVPYYEAIRKGVGLDTWVRNATGIIGGSLALLREISRFNATHLHIGSTAWMINFLPALIASRIPLIFRAGDVPPMHHPLYQWIWQYACRRAAVFVCASHFIRSSLIALGAAPEKCIVVYTPPPGRPRQFTGSTSDPRTTPARSQPLTLLYIGQISADKGVDKLIEAAIPHAQHGTCRLIIAGDYSWHNPFADALVERVADLGLQEQICFTGFVEDIDPLYAESHVHVAPSLYPEAYGLTVVEAKERGMPSIVFPSGGLVELVQHQVEGLVCSESTIEALSLAVQHYIDTPEDIVRHGAAAHASLGERLRVQDYGQHWEHVYASTC